MSKKVDTAAGAYVPLPKPIDNTTGGTATLQGNSVIGELPLGILENAQAGQAAVPLVVLEKP